MLIEICCPSIEAATAAQNSGADRIELCAELDIGGITPAHEDIMFAAGEIKIPVNVLIRPRGGSFVFSEKEHRRIMEDIEFCAKNGVNGVVIGALTADRKIDKARSREMINLAHNAGLSVTYHRAIDCTKDIFKALADIMELGADRVLTSGGCESAFEGISTLSEMVQLAADRIIILAGAGITADNAQQIVEHTRVTEIHGSRKEIISAIRNPQPHCQDALYFRTLEPQNPKTFQHHD